MRVSLPFKTLVATAAVLMTAAVGRTQDKAHALSTPEPQKPASTRRKIWTDDDIASLRSPADDYLAEKEAQAAAEALAKVRKVTDGACPSSAKIKVPQTVEEAERAIKDSLEDIQDQKATLVRLSKELDESPEDQKAEKTKEIERRTAVLEESQKELKGLQDRREDLASKATSANSTGTVTSDSVAPLATP